MESKGLSAGEVAEEKPKCTKSACKVGVCPLCTKKGLTLVLFGLFLTWVLPGNLSYIGLFTILSAYVLGFSGKL